MIKGSAKWAGAVELLLSYLTTVMSSNQESHLKGLLFIETWVAEAGVVERQVFVSQADATTRALRDSISSQLKVNAPQIAAFLLMYGQGLLQLGEDVGELTGLDACGR